MLVTNSPFLEVLPRGMGGGADSGPREIPGRCCPPFSRGFCLQKQIRLAPS